LESAMEVALRDRHHEAEVGLDELLLGDMRACARRGDLLDDAAQDRRPHPDVALELARLALGGAALGRSVEGALAAARAVEREPACTLLELRAALGRARQLVHHRQHLAPAR